MIFEHGWASSERSSRSSAGGRERRRKKERKRTTTHALCICVTWGCDPYDKLRGSILGSGARDGLLELNSHLRGFVPTTRHATKRNGSSASGPTLPTSEVIQTRNKALFSPSPLLCPLGQDTDMSSPGGHAKDKIARQPA